MPNLPRGCPLKPGKYNTYNISVKSDNDIEVEAFISPISLPNGLYRNTLRFYTNTDPEGICYWFHVEKYVVKNVEISLKK